MRKQSNSSVAVLEEVGDGVAPGAAEIVRGEALRKTFRSGAQEITPLDGVDFAVARGEMIAIVGPSGAGKSTLLHLLAALDTPTSGTVYFGGNSLESLAEAELAEYRNRAVGFVWQRHHLLPDFTAAENVAMPLLIRGTSLGEALRAAANWLGEVGLGDRAEQRGGQLSGGEQQRVAIARALVNGPQLLLADEPTGDLDERSAENVFELMQHLHKTHQLTSILATHNLSIARRADRVLNLEHGKLASGLDALAGSTVPLPRTASVGAQTPAERG
ncbi:MAG: ABC transporter ATP-binding protein [Candidatus Acidiferrales bacterium]